MSSTSLREHRRSLLLVPVLGCALAVLLGGCTQRQDPDDYRASLDKALTVRDQAVQQLDSRQLTTDSEYQAVQGQVQAALDRLDSQAPPKRYEKAHDMFTDSLDGLAVLLGKMGHCAALEQTSLQDGRACRQSIGQDVFDTLRNDFTESDAIYRQEGLSLPQLRGADDGDRTGSDGGGDTLD